MKLSKANPLQVEIEGEMYPYLGFYYPGNNTDWDNVYGVPYFGNFWIEPFEVKLKGSRLYTFNTAEAAYQASKWWGDSNIVNQFENTSNGDDAFKLKRQLDRKNIPYQDKYGGYQSGEEVMFEILKCKFSKPALKDALLATGNSYLLEHAAILSHQDMVWSDGNTGNGTNHLGICLMKVREFYFPGQGNPFEGNSVSSQVVILACTKALRVEMIKLGLSADNRHPTLK